jgi:hypothetical protein
MPEGSKQSGTEREKEHKKRSGVPSHAEVYETT